MGEVRAHSIGWLRNKGGLGKGRVSRGEQEGEGLQRGPEKTE